MQKRFDTPAGEVRFEEGFDFPNQEFGYTLFEQVVDPANPEGPRAIGMHVPQRSTSKMWELTEPGYTETIELLSGSGYLLFTRDGSTELEVHELTPDDPTAGGIVIGHGDRFAVATGEEEIVVLSRPSKEFDKSYEVTITPTPNHPLAELILTKIALLETVPESNN